MPQHFTSVTCKQHASTFPLFFLSLLLSSLQAGKAFQQTQSEWLTTLSSSFYTTEEQVYDLFSKCGEIKRLIMGLDRFNKTPCGFCFVEYYTHQDALDCLKYVGGTKLDERIIRTDLDPGFEEGRQYGRGKSGGQVRDEYRDDFDEGRGGLGRAIQQTERLREAEKNRDGEQEMREDYGRLR